MARRTTSRSRRQGRSSSRGLLGRRPARRLSVLAVALVLGSWWLGVDVAPWLPAPAASIVQETETWLDATLRELRGDEAADPENDGPMFGPTGAPDSAAVAQALALLDRIRVEPERPRGYDREAWPHWMDADGDCQDARQEVLVAESVERVRLSANGCRIEAGLWRDAYTGETTRDPTRLDVDHMVPLAEAFRSGGRDWSQERRAAFANDVEDSRTLIAVSASANRAKGDQGPEDWLPPETAYRCRYVADWVSVKVRWSLSMDERERVTVGNLLRDCASR